MSYLWNEAAERGLFRQLCLHSHTAQYAQLKRSGEFNKEWQDEQKLYNSKHLDELREKALNTEVTKAEDSLFARLK